MILSEPQHWRAAAVNLFDVLRRGHLADTTPQPATVIDQGPQRVVSRFEPNPDAPTGRHDTAVLLVPPLAAPALCFDLRRGCSVAQFLVDQGYPTYLVDYGEIAFGDRNLGVEHWIRDVLPQAVAAVHADHGGNVHLVGWCLGGLFALLSTADNPELPVASISAVASPLDMSLIPLVAPLRPLAQLTVGRIVSALYRTLGSAPAPIVAKMFQLSGFDKYVTRPIAVLNNITDGDFLAQIEAVDLFMGQMLAYPGRTFGQLYHRFFRANALAQGTFDIDGRQIDLAAVQVPVLSVAGLGDGIAPKPSVHAIAEFLPQATLRDAPGGHLGVLTGRAARDTTWRIVDEFLSATEASTARPANRIG